MRAPCFWLNPCPQPPDSHAAPISLLQGAKTNSIIGVLPSALSIPADGWIHKAVVLGSGMHIIEEMQVFKQPQSVENLVISPMLVASDL